MGLTGSPSVLVDACIVIKYCLVVMESIVVRAAPRVLANQVPCPDEVLALHQVRCLARLAELWGGEGSTGRDGVRSTGDRVEPNPWFAQIPAQEQVTRSGDLR